MKNTIENKSNKSGKIYTRVVFLMAQNPSTDMWEPIALFPDLYWDGMKRENVSYQHNGQHGPCCKAFALLDCQVPTARQLKAVQRLKHELEHLDEPYALTVLDSAEWMKQNAHLAREFAKNAKHYEQSEEDSTALDNFSGVSDEQLDFLDKLFDDGFGETKKVISDIFDEELGDITANEGEYYSEFEDDELLYPPMVAGQDNEIMAELKSRAA